MKLVGWLIALAAALASLHGLESVWGTGRDSGTNVEAVRDPARRALEIRSDLRAESCWVELAVRVRGAAPSGSELRFEAVQQTGQRLVVRADSLGPRQWRLAIVEPDTSLRERRMFSWRPGVPVLVSAGWVATTGGAVFPASLEVEDWTVWLAEDKHDSRGRTHRRTLFTWLAAASITAAATVAVYDRRKKEPTETGQEVTAASCIARMIESVGGKDPDGDRMRTLLRMIVTKGTSRDEAIRAAGMEPRKPEANVVTLRAISYLEERRNNLVNDLLSYPRL